MISIAAYDAAYEHYDYPLASAIAMLMGFVELLVIAAVLGWRALLYTGSTRRERLMRRRERGDRRDPGAPGWSGAW